MQVIYPCVGYIPICRIYTHVQDIYPCVGYIPMCRLYTHMQVIYPCVGYIPMCRIYTHYYTCSSTHVIHVQDIHLYYMCETCITGVLTYIRGLCITCVIYTTHILNVYHIRNIHVAHLVVCVKLHSHSINSRTILIFFTGAKCATHYMFPKFDEYLKWLNR